MTRTHFLTLSAVALVSLPAAATTVLFGGGQAGPTQGADGAVFTYLQNRYGAANVTYIQTSAAVTGDESGFDVFVISSTPGSGTIRGKWQTSTTPIVNWEEAVADSGAGEFGMSDVVMTKSTTTTQLSLTPGHPITAGLPATISFLTGAAEITNTGSLFAGLTTVAIATDGTGAGNPALFVAEAGDAVNPGAGITGNVSPARRVMFPMTDSTFNSLTPEGLQLFGQSVDWAAGVPEPSSSLLALTGLALLLRRRR